MALSTSLIQLQGMQSVSLIDINFRHAVTQTQSRHITIDSLTVYSSDPFMSLYGIEVIP